MNKENKPSGFLKTFLNQSFTFKSLIILGRILPRPIGLKIASMVGTMLGRNKDNPKIQAIRANQYVIHDESLGEDELEELPKIIYRSSTKCFFDYFYFLFRPQKLQKTIEMTPKAQKAFDRIKNDQATVFVCPHLSNFDLIGYALTLHDYIIQVLSYPEPVDTYKMQNNLRESLGVNITPLTLSAFRTAMKRLQNGGSVLTGLDRPLPEEHQTKYKPTFFGHTANLPVTYIRMAIQAKAPVFVVSATSQPGGLYRLEVSDPIWMESAEDLETEIIYNANRVLEFAEGLILKYSRQWAMFYPIWPEYLGI